MQPFITMNHQRRRHHPDGSARRSCRPRSDILSATVNGGEVVSSSIASARRRNIFHEYDKPILLLGGSSDNRELNRLADSLVSKQLDGGNIISCTDAISVERILSDNNHWPDVLVVDFNRSSMEDDLLIDLVKTLYDKEVLSVYVNVNPSGMDEGVAAQRKKLEDKVFVPFSDYELCIRDEGSSDATEADWEHMEWELVRLLARARLIPAIPGDTTRSDNTAHLTMGQNTFFLSLSFPEIAQVEPYVKDLCQDVDAMEYRADLLDCRDNRFDLLYGMQLLRKYCRPHVARSPALPFVKNIIEDNMPVVYTVRTQHQAGTYPDDEVGIAKMFDMLEWGLRGGVEVLDVESAWDYSKTRDLLDLAQERYASQILGSHHVVGEIVTLEDAVGLFEQCALNGRAHGAKVVLSIDKDEDDRMAYEAALIASELARADGEPVIPNISLILGDVGQFSRVINLPFTPVTHETLPFKAAPGQLTANEIMATRLLTKIFQSKKYAILGHNIAYSVSPQMQGAAFAATKLPHEYVRADVPTVKEFVDSDFFQSSDFGGCSVTIPHKQEIMKYVNELSEAAERIGSVNTLIVREEFVDEDFKRILCGDNTDWRGIYKPLNRLLPGFLDSDSDYALILGAGGTARAAAYVADKLGLQKIYYNRTPDKAAELREAFGGTVITNLNRKSSPNCTSLGDVLSTSGSLRVVISTLPAAAEFVLPDWILSKDKSELPVVFDVNYKPYDTELLKQATAVRCNVVRGSEMLWEQGVGQFELWTERAAPYRIMKHVVLENCKED